MNLKEGLTVLSLFDGMSCGMIALDRIGIKVKSYYASEIDKPAMKVAKHNWPNIIHIGDVTKVRYAEGWLYTENGDFYVGRIDLLIGGSPCQGFSFAGKQLNFEDPRSKLFFEYVRLREETACEYFLLENVLMKKEHQNVISEHLGIEPIFINSSILSAQNRKRLYWTNISYFGAPLEKSVVINDILETNELFGAARIVGRKINPHTGKRDDYNLDLQTVQRVEINSNPDKTNCLTSVEKDNVLIKLTNVHPSGRGMNGNVYDINGLAPTLTTNKGEGNKIGCRQIGIADDIKGFDSNRRIYDVDGKCSTLISSTGGHKAPKVGFYQDKDLWILGVNYRKLTSVECERLQTVPDNYSSIVSNTQRYKMLGNGWTVDVICHLFEPLLHEI